MAIDADGLAGLGDETLRSLAGRLGVADTSDRRALAAAIADQLSSDTVFVVGKARGEKRASSTTPHEWDPDLATIRESVKDLRQQVDKTASSLLDQSEKIGSVEGLKTFITILMGAISAIAVVGTIFGTLQMRSLQEASDRVATLTQKADESLSKAQMLTASTGRVGTAYRRYVVQRVTLDAEAVMESFSVVLPLRAQADAFRKLNANITLLKDLRASDLPADLVETDTEEIRALEKLHEALVETLPLLGSQAPPDSIATPTRWNELEKRWEHLTAKPVTSSPEEAHPLPQKLRAYAFNVLGILVSRRYGMSEPGKSTESQRQRADHAFRRAIRLDRLLGRAYSNRGVVEISRFEDANMQGDTPTAQRHLKTAIRLYDESLLYLDLPHSIALSLNNLADAQYRLARINLDAGNYPSAEDAMSQAEKTIERAAGQEVVPFIVYATEAEIACTKFAIARATKGKPASVDAASTRVLSALSRATTLGKRFDDLDDFRRWAEPCTVLMQADPSLMERMRRVAFI